MTSSGDAGMVARVTCEMSPERMACVQAVPGVTIHDLRCQNCPPDAPRLTLVADGKS